METLKRFKAVAKGKYSIKRMILFGSHASGKVRQNSDIDIMVVTGKRDSEIVAKLIDEWHMKQGIEYPVDFVDYTSTEFNMLAKRISLVRHVLENGIEI
jgi:predicted nucleotidyltransferase